MNECRKIQEYLDLARELKGAVEPVTIVVGDIGTIPKKTGTESGATGYTYLPTTPLGQDMTHGQFLSGVKQV